MEDSGNNKTKVWEYYEQGRAYNNSVTPDVYTTVNTNIEFFAGNQWLHIPNSPAMSRLPRPVFNIIKRITSLFVASLTASSVAVSLDPLSYYEGTKPGSENNLNASTFANAEIRNLFEKLKMDYRIREALFDGAQTGDYCAHFFWNPDALPYGGAFGIHKGEIEMELVDGVNVMFGNPNIHDVQSQPYILVIGRDTIENLQYEADRYRKIKNAVGKGGTLPNDIDIDTIQPDADYNDQAAVGGKIELSPQDKKTGKALFAYMYTKVRKDEVVTDENGNPVLENVVDANGNPVQEKDENGKPIIDMDGQPVYKQRKVTRMVTSVHVTKATKTSIIFEDVDTGLSLYPLAWGNWERQKNQYHGRALVTGIVPNQIFINSMMALVFRHLQLQSFPKTLYNADLIGQWNNEVGCAIGVRGLQPGQDLRSVATSLQPADMSNQIVMAIDKVMQYTKECLGATDAQMGTMNLDNTSALMVLNSSSEVPLENPKAILHEWVEDIAAILLDMMGTYYGERPVLMDMTVKEPVLDSAGNPILDPDTGEMKVNTAKRRAMQEYDFRQLKNLWFNISVEVGATTRFSEIAMVQTLDNLRRDGTLDLIHYLERIPDRLIPRKQELIDDLRASVNDAAAKEAASANSEEPPRDAPGFATKPAGPASVGGPVDTDKLVGQMPERLQKIYDRLPYQSSAALGKALQKQAQDKI